MPAITASAKPSTCVTRTTTAWSCIGTARRQEWPRTPEGGVAMFTKRLDLHGLLAELEAQTNAPQVETGPQDS